MSSLGPIQVSCWFTAPTPTARPGRLVIQRLQGAGLAVTVVQNPLTSPADDVAHTRRIVRSTKRR